MATKVPINDPMIDPRTGEYAVIAPGHNFKSVTQKIAGLVLTANTPLGWFFGMIVAGGVASLVLVALTWLFLKGTGIWGVTMPGAWGFAIINFVWWIGIGHAGTLISAILLLFKQTWRNSINRFAEAMTIFAVAMAGLMPILHLGRPWFFYWLIPYPDIMNVWPQWRSPLVWDIFAIGTYIIVSILFWYMGLIPDLATLRDRASSRAKQIVYGLGALGWRGEARQWRRFDTAYLLMAGLATPLVISVHSVVSLDFSIGNTPGWHSTIFPPYFVAGALFSGFAMALTISIPLRAIFGLKDFITLRHLDNIGKIMLVCGLIVAYSYLMEIFMAFYSGDEFDQYMILNRMRGPYAPIYWIVILFNVVLPQSLWFKRIRLSVGTLFVLSIVVNIGMWLERFMIIVTSLHRDFLPSSWDMFYPTFWDWAILVGSLGAFGWLFLMFVRFLPAISISEMRKLVLEKKEGEA
jgi:molybdopterin-containing oxidoreductase family membrane subunit